MNNAKAFTAGPNTYSGVAQLEVMEEAKNYNAYLLAFVTKSCSTQQKLLDYGAGTGFFAQRLHALGYTVDCLEPDSELATDLSDFGLSVLSSLSSAQNGSYDLIYSFNVLEHIDDDDGALQRMLECLKPGGRLILYVPAFEILFSSMDRIVGHKRRYRLRQLREKVSDAGFFVDEALYTDSLGFIAALLYRLIDPGDGQLDRRLLRSYDRYIFPLSRALDFICWSFVGKNIVIRAARRALDEANSIE